MTDTARTTPAYALKPGWLADDMKKASERVASGFADPRFVKMKDFAWRAAAMLRFLKEHEGECLGDHPDWLARIDSLLNETPG